jgi:hypothetical protein
MSVRRIGMGYVRCPTCGLIAFSVAGWSSIDYCARCGTKLPMGRRAVPPITLHPDGRTQPPSGGFHARIQPGRRDL